MLFMCKLCSDKLNIWWYEISHSESIPDEKWGRNHGVRKAPFATSSEIVDLDNDQHWLLTSQKSYFPINNETTTGNIHQLLGSGLAEKLNQNLVKSLNLKTIVYRKTKGERSVLNNILGIHPLKSKIWMTQICIHYAQSHFFGKSKSYGKAQWHHTVNYFWPMKRTCTF